MSLSRLLSPFPRGAAGTGLLMLRFTISGTLIMQGQRYFSASRILFDEAWLSGAAAYLLGLALLIGIFTRTSAVLTALGATSLQCCAQPSLVLAATSISLALTGPGAFSVDACLFGFREVVIPQAVRRKRRDNDLR